MNIVIMAGGGGSRLWPLSRHGSPKQFLDFGTGTTLLRQTYMRVCRIARPENIYVTTIEEYKERTRSILPEIPEENFFYEPARRDTAPVFAATATRLQSMGKGEEPVIFLASDHVFTREEEFTHDVQKVENLIQKNPRGIITIGHIPTSPETGFGYIEVKENIEGYNDTYTVKSFKEKPDKETAETFVTSGRHFWNMATFGFLPSYMISEIRSYEPQIMESIDEFAQALEAGDEKRANRAYARTPKMAIDYAVMERTPNIVVVTGDYGWNDVGNWSAVKEVFGVDGDIIGNGHHIHVDGENNFIYNMTNKAVSLIGKKNTIVVVTDDAVLVTDISSAHKVKDVVQRLQDDKKKELL